MGMWLSAPHKTGSFLKRKLGKSGTFACKSGPWNHKKEEFTKSNEKVSVSCDSLNNVYVKTIKKWSWKWLCSIIKRNKNECIVAGYATYGIPIPMPVITGLIITGILLLVSYQIGFV